ncbi:MAG: glycerol-3-phosphate 1-O-acyltransferase PlsY [Thermoanaerobaculia bacterium]
MTTRWLPLLAGAYLFGSLSFSLVVVWLLQRRDVRSVGSGNAGATNVLRAAGRLPALLVLVLDIAKGALPVVIARRWGAPEAVAALAGAAAVLGHVAPVFFAFRGGKGVATSAGALFELFPLAALAAVVIFLAAVASTRWVSLGSLLAAGVLPLCAWLFGRLGWGRPADRQTLAAAIAIAGVVVWRHRANLTRLIAGTERRLGEPRV